MAGTRVQGFPWVLAMLVALAFGLGGCRGDNFEIEQHTPEAVIESAKRMVMEGRAELLPELIYAQDDRMRRMLRGLGGVLGALEDLGYTVAKRYPAEVSRMRGEAERAAAEGRSSSLMSRLTSARGPSRPESRFSRSDDPMADAMMSLMADPFGWIKANADNLQVMPLSDGAVSLTWKGMPILPPFGVIMRQHDDKWFIELPLGLPGIRNFVPKSDEELDLWLGVLGSLENSLVDLRVEIEKGRVRSLDDASGKIVEYVMPTAMISFFAYDKYRREQRAREREEARAAAAVREQERQQRLRDRAARRDRPEGSGDAQAPAGDGG
ncbi:MAG: hypothetical protein KF866_08250 [Phycisphaeraceae bacterium]|nr:hypothetical protein [Phycisphaeraceae bacterium]MCW5753867.1 hypothetical protein [Phycisphaeraceae bacterium]